MLYKNSSQQLSLGDFKNTVSEMYAQLRGTFTRIEQFLEKLGCL
jgi:hypothetical protein